MSGPEPRKRGRPATASFSGSLLRLRGASASFGKLPQPSATVEEAGAKRTVGVSSQNYSGHEALV